MLDGSQLVFQQLRVADGYESDPRGVELKEKVHEVKVLLREAVDTFKRNSVKVGRLLSYLRASGLYKYCYVYQGSCAWTYGSNYLSEPFFEFCYRQFGLKKSTVYALEDVARKFGDDEGNTLPAYASYSYSQLVELSSVDEEDLIHYNSSMTVKEIQKRKKEIEKEKQATESVPSASDVVPEPVNPYIFSDMEKAKSEFQKFCKYWFELKHISLVSNEENVFKNIKGSAFGGLFFDYLKEHKFFDKQV